MEKLTMMEESIFTYIGDIVGKDSHQSIVILHLILVFLIITVLVKISTKRLSVVPKGMQNIMEVYILGVLSMGKDVIGENLARKYLPLVGTIGIFIFISNLIGIIPGFESPTSNINVTLSLALLVFGYYNYEGIKKNGLKKYFKHFTGPVKILAPLMFPIEIVSHFSRIISLSFRLFGNIKGDDLFLWVLLMIVPYFAPLPGYILLTFSAFLQTFVFMILIYVYLAGAILLDEEH